MTLHCDLTLRRPGFALHVDLRFEGARFVALVGPSGAGKSTLLHILSGLVDDAEGHISFEGVTWQDKQRVVPAHVRPVGFVFQNSALFSHLDVAGNLRFGMNRVPLAGRRLAFDDVVDLLGITPLLRRRTETLSGGECQRVALGRALLTSPRILLFDEPLASLDAASRAHIIPYIAAVQRALKLPTLYVTHALHEVMRLADDVVYLERGSVRGHGALNAMLTDPALPLCHADDAGVALDLPVVSHEPEFHLMQLALGEARLSVSARHHPLGQRVRVLIRARDVGISTIAPEHTSILNVLPARVVDIHEQADPAHRLVRLEAAGEPLLARVTHKAVHQLGLAPGSVAFAHVKSVALAEG